MNICKAALRIAAAHPVYLAVYVLMLTVMGALVVGNGGVPASASAEDGEPEAYQAFDARVAYVDRDASELSAALGNQLAREAETVAVEDEPFALQDALATGHADAVVMVPEGFGVHVLEAARAGGELPAIEVAYGSDTQAAALLAERVRQLTGLLGATAALEADASAGEVARTAFDAAAAQAEVELVDGGGEGSAGHGLAAYLKFGSYSVTCSVVVVAGIVMTAIVEPRVRARQLASPARTLRTSGWVLAACGLLALAVCIWTIAVGFVTKGGFALFAAAPGQVALAVLVFVAFASVPLALAHLLSQLGCGEQALNAIGNIGGMLLSFLGGVWVPLEFMGEPLQVAARFTPTYWMSDAIQAALYAPEVDGELLVRWTGDVGIVLPFAVSLALFGVVASRACRQEA